MRIAALLPCLLLLSGCLATGVQPSPDFPVVASARSPDGTATVAPRASGTRSGGSAAGGGATTSAAQAPLPDDPEERKDPLTQARVDCWMKVEHEKGLRDIDRRIAYVDKCVNATMKGK